jgi:nucleoside-diphosphate-sugar epimerase
MGTADTTKPRILVTGCSGLIGSRTIKHLQDKYAIVGFDVEPVADQLQEYVDWIQCDLTEDDSVSQAIENLREQFGDQLASVIHLAAYYDFSGEPSPLYRQLTVDGTGRLLHQLKNLNVGQFVFASSLLVMESAEGDQPITEYSALDAEWDYPQSKLAAEKAIAHEHGEIPAVILRIAGVYDEDCHSLPLSQHISRIYEKQMESYFFPGDKQHGQAFVHLDDLAECFAQTVARRKDLGNYEVFLIGEEDVMSYAHLQEELGKMIHASEWPTIRIPKTVAKAGAWVQEKLAKNEEDEPFIKPWMIDLADQNYPLSIRKARQQLGWEPKRTLRATLPEMVGRLYRDTRRWYEINKLPVPENVS